MNPDGPAAAVLRFDRRPAPVNVVFGAGRVDELPAELGALGLGRGLVLCTPGQQPLGERIAAMLGERSCGVHPGAVVHVPVEVAEEAVAVAAKTGADCCVAVGGGSAIGLAKAVALRSGLPVVAVPTTYAGSEMTPVWGQTDAGVKRTGRDPRVLPRGVVYDPQLTTGLPVPVSVTSGINALAHAAEALYAPDLDPITALMAQEAVRALAGGLPGVAADPREEQARATVLYGAWLGGSCLATTTMGLHHKLCHVLGGALDLPHAPTHTVLLPHVLAFNSPAAPDPLQVLARTMGAPQAPAAIRDLAAGLGAPVSLAELGVDRGVLPELAQRAATGPYRNPRPADADDIAALLDRAWCGEDPRP